MGPLQVLRRRAARRWSSPRPPRAPTATPVGVALENNLKSYAYADPDWQAFVAHCAKNHMEEALHHDLDEDEQRAITITVFSRGGARPPQQLRAALLRARAGSASTSRHQGRLFRTPRGGRGRRLEGVIPAGHIPLKGQFPSGQVEADGVTPTTEIKCRIQAAGLKSTPRNLDGYWYPPSAQEMEEDRAAAAAQAAGVPPPRGFGRHPNPGSVVGNNSATARPRSAATIAEVPREALRRRRARRKRARSPTRAPPRCPPPPPARPLAASALQGPPGSSSWGDAGPVRPARTSAERAPREHPPPGPWRLVDGADSRLLEEPPAERAPRMQ